MTVTTGPDLRPARPDLPVQGALAAVAGGLLLLCGLPGPGALAAGLAVGQVVLVLGLLALVDAPAGGTVFVLAVAAAAAADVLVVRARGDVDVLAGVVALSLVAALLHQLARRDRSRVTESLADSLLVVVVVAAAACLVAVRDRVGGDAALAAGVAGAAAGLLLGRLGDLAAPRALLLPGATRTWPGLLIGLAAGSASGAAVGLGEQLRPGPAALVGLACALAAAAADLAVDIAALELSPGTRDARRVAALQPVAALLPYALVGPVALVAARLALP